MDTIRNVVLKYTGCHARKLMTIGIIGLGACSDGSSSSLYKNGTLLDSPVTGVTYSTATTTGTTDAQGQFRYRNGEEVTFTLGSLTLGSATGANTVTVFDLAGVANPPTTLDAFSEQLYPSSGLEITPLHRAINLGMLLQSLDADENLNNGIDIPAAAAALVSPERIDLDMRPWEFRDGGNILDANGLPGLLRAAAAQNALAARPVKNPSLALEHMLDQLGITISNEVSTLNSYDADADGNPDSQRSITFNPDGKLTADEYDTDGDSVIDRRTTYTYNANLQTLSQQRDDDGDGNLESSTEYEYDAFGATTRRVNRDATSITREIRTVLDTNGKLIEREISTPTSRAVEYWTVDSNGLRSIYEYDRDGDGTIDRRSQLEYGTQTRSDRWLVSNIDHNMDGNTDSRTTRTFNAFGQLLSNEQDSDLDGVPDYAVRYSWDSNGRQISYERYSDGVNLNYANQHSRDANGNTTQLRIDQNGDGLFERQYDYVYNSDGLLTEYTFRDNNVVTNIYTYTYDSNGNQITYAFDSNADGTPERIYTSTFNAQGQRTRQEEDSNNDGNIDAISTWSNFVQIGFGNYF